ncbi:gas vesicle protein K [Streptomyces sp. NBC_00388]|uniref:gas vesicle protein K n=1 Tax=Streptomyces sp. NBC_00388 TaxID=2975735 RepID=UPI002E22E7DA
MTAEDPQGVAGELRLNDLTQAAAHAFDLLPAGPESGSGTGQEAGQGSGQGSHQSEMARRLRTNPETVERDLIKLVLTIVELLRQLMERTALHRVDQGDLSDDQEERIGLTLMILQDRMTELCDRYGLTMEDLNLDLGPLGSLLPGNGS